MAFLVKQSNQVSEPDPFTRDEVINKIINAGDWSPDVEGSDRHLPFEGACSNYVRFRRVFILLSERNKKEKKVRKSRYEVTIDLPHVLLGDELVKWVWLRPYLGGWDELIVVKFKGSEYVYIS